MSIIDVQVNTGVDDGDEGVTEGVMTLDGYRLYIRSYPTALRRRLVALIFDAVIPKDAVILACHLTSYVWSETYDDPNFNIHFEKVASPAMLTTDAYNITSRNRTEASVPWVANGIGIGRHQSPSLVAPLQELVKAHSTERICLIIRPNDNVDKYLSINSFEQGSGMASLHIEYAIGADVPPVADFIATPDRGPLPLTVQFTDTSEGVVDRWLWDFEDGGSSTEQNPIHTFLPDPIHSPPYYYKVLLDVSGPGGYSYASHNIYIEEPTPLAVSSLFYTQEELPTLQALSTAPSHSAMWNNISSWADAHINDAPPEFLPYGTASNVRRATSRAIRMFLDNMVFMYHMTGGTQYAEAAYTWMLSIATNWSAWYPDAAGNPLNSGQNHNNMHYMAVGFANGYYALRGYFSEADRIVIRDSMVLNNDVNYQRYKDRDPVSEGIWFGRAVGLGQQIGLTALALGDDYANSSAWLEFAVAAAEEGMSGGGMPDGGWISGPSYGSRVAISMVFSFFDVLRRVDGRNMFATYSDFLAHAPYYFIYTTMEDDHTGKAVPLQMEDTTGNQDYFTWSEYSLCFLYKSAKEYDDGYAQMAGDTYAKQNLVLSYIWKDPDVAPLAISNLPLERIFEDIGYIIWRAGWGVDDLLFLFKSGRSMGHCGPNQNTFVAYKNGRPLTAPPGYATTWLEYKVTWPNNCLTVGDYIGNDGNLYGYGQAHEPGDLGGAVVPLGTRGIIQEALSEDGYNYVRGDASALYTGQEFPETFDWPMLSSGALDKWLRHIVFIKDLQYFVIFDDVLSPIPQQINWWYNAIDIYNEDRTSAPPSLKLNDDLITQSVGNKRLEIKILEPTAFNSNLRWNTGLYGGEFSYILLWPETNAIETNFLSVMTVDNRLSSGQLPTRKIQQDNCLGVMVDIGENLKDLILFSSDGLPVDRYIELNGYYASADGREYTFNETKVRAQFDNYQVMRLEQVGAIEVYLTIDAQEGGITDPAPGTWALTQGDTITITAVPAEGYRFDHWEGDIAGMPNPATFQVNSDTSIVAVFTPYYPAGCAPAALVAAVILPIIAAIYAWRRLT